LVLALLWIATLLAVLFEAHDTYAHATQRARGKVVQAAVLIDFPAVAKCPVLLENA
jgi:hypothetical protein